jgi:hypothetical protein
MPVWLTGALRSALQIGWAYVIAYAAGKGFNLPTDVPVWLDEAAFAATLAVFVALVQWLETRPADSVFGRATRALAKVLMLGASRVVVYQKPVDESLEYLRSTP